MSLNITNQTINQYQTFLRRKGLSNSSITRKMASLKNFTGWALKKGLIISNPFAANQPAIPTATVKNSFLPLSFLLQKILNRPVLSNPGIPKEKEIPSLGNPSNYFIITALQPFYYRLAFKLGV